MITIRRALILILAISALLAVPAGAVSAAGGSPTKIVLSLKFPAFHGKLTSPRHGCLGSRTVKMYRRRSGKTKQLGSDKSEDNGKWAIPVGKHLTSGEYFATVAQRGKCKAAKSKVVTVD